MKSILCYTFILISLIGNSQGTKNYFKSGAKVDPSLVNEEVGDRAKKVNHIFHFRNDNKSHFIKIMNLEGKTYAQSISEFVILDFNSKKGGDLHRKVEKLANITIDGNNFISDQLKASYILLKEKGTNYENINEIPIKLMVCSKDKFGNTNCRINDDEVEITPEEFPGKYPQTGFTRLGDEDLRNKKPKELEIMRNEIYARYGYRFSEPSVADYFFSQNWYEPLVDNKLVELNDLELDNVAMIDLYRGKVAYHDLNLKSYSQVLPLETSSNSTYGENILKSMKYMKQDTLGGSKCVYTEYNKKGIATFQQDCMINKDKFVNYFNKDLLVEHVDGANDTYFYYDFNGLPLKTVKLDYTAGTTEETFFTYDSNQNITQKDIYQNNNFNESIYYDYDYDGNLVKEYYKDKEGNEEMVTEYFFENRDNLNTGYLKNKETGCNYEYNDTQDLLLSKNCFKIVKDKEYPFYRLNRDVKEVVRGKNSRLSSVKLVEEENYKYYISILEYQYY
ncbi:YARHG domain-containing protein [Apibacter muscae]|uniref:YARHG domain-containing protein n=1 Tax=Apibacter muscae TaxID=2509004 RepID=UPI0011AC9041|nr:YARHG domain-containing protein [Apibacter muscae]TWP28042.1 YARHG domain-containing protein [Apibacter muscae]